MSDPKTWVDLDTPEDVTLIIVRRNGKTRLFMRGPNQDFSDDLIAEILLDAFEQAAHAVIDAEDDDESNPPPF